MSKLTLNGWFRPGEGLANARLKRSFSPLSFIIAASLLVGVLPALSIAENLEVLEVQHGVTWSIKTAVVPLKSGGGPSKPAVLTAGSVVEDGERHTMRTLFMFDFSDLSKTTQNRSIKIKNVIFTLTNWGEKENGSEITTQLHLLGDGGPHYQFVPGEVDWLSAPSEPGGTVGDLLSTGDGIGQIYAVTEFPSTPAFVAAIQEAMDARRAIHLILVAQNEEEEAHAAFFGQILAGRANPKPKLTIEYVYTE